MPDVTLLDPVETEAALAGHRYANTALGKVAEQLMNVVDTGSSVFVTGLTESTVNSLRTRMHRNDVQIVVRKVEHDGQRGHVILAKRIPLEDRG